MATILFPLPDRDFDVTEVAVPWKLLRERGHEVIFATPEGKVAAADPLLLTGVVFGALGARPEPKAFYRELERAPEFLHPRRWDEVDPDQIDALFLAGGHAQGMKPYLESAAVQRLATAFFAQDKPVAAICHGAQILAAAGVLQGRGCSAYPACSAEVVLAGGKFAEIAIDAAVTDGNLVTAPAWPAHPAWIAQFLKLLGTRIEP